MNPSWEQLLADQPVPPAPIDFQHRVHRRLNGALLMSHFAELALRVWPAVVWALLPAVAELLAATLGGKRRRKEP